MTRINKTINYLGHAQKCHDTGLKDCTGFPMQSNITTVILRTIFMLYYFTMKQFLSRP